MEMILILEFKYSILCHLQKQNQLKYETLKETKEDMIAASRNNKAEILLKSFQPTSNKCITQKKKTSNK